MKNTEKRVTLYILAGVATSDNFMEEFRLELERRYEQAGFELECKQFFPYGNWNRSLIKQLMEIGHDLMPKLGRNRSFVRGQMVAKYIIETHKAGPIVIIGHSSGGVVGVHAASLLEQAQFPDVRVVQVGSPKCAVSLQHRDSTLFIRAVNHYGKSIDPITRLGSWGGWIRKGRLVSWNRRIAAPAFIHSIPIVGGHADYFRNSPPFFDENGSSNLDKTMDCIWNWII
jgi:hypothetical protein